MSPWIVLKNISYQYGSLVPSSHRDRQCFRKDRSGSGQSSRREAGTACCICCHSSSHHTWHGCGTQSEQWHLGALWPAIVPQDSPLQCEHAAQSAAPHLKGQRQVMLVVPAFLWCCSAQKASCSLTTRLEILLGTQQNRIFLCLCNPPPHRPCTNKDMNNICTLHSHLQGNNKRQTTMSDNCRGSPQYKAINLQAAAVTKSFLPLSNRQTNAQNLQHIHWTAPKLKKSYLTAFV